MPKVEINSVSKQDPHSVSEFRENVLEGCYRKTNTNLPKTDGDNCLRSI